MTKYEVTWTKSWEERGTEIIEADSAEEAEDLVLDQIDQYDGIVTEHDNQTEVNELEE